MCWCAYIKLNAIWSFYNKYDWYWDRVSAPSTFLHHLLFAFVFNFNTLYTRLSHTHTHTLHHKRGRPFFSQDKYLPLCILIPSLLIFMCIQFDPLTYSVSFIPPSLHSSNRERGFLFVLFRLFFHYFFFSFSLLFYVCWHYLIAHNKKKRGQIHQSNNIKYPLK